MRTFLVITVVIFLAFIGYRSGSARKLSLSAIVAGDFEDDGDQAPFNGVSVHVCYGNALMRGVDAASNRFMCSAASGVGAPAVDLAPPGGTQANIFFRGLGHQVHVCPTGSAMIGWHEGNNWLICAPAPGLANTHPDLGTQEQEPNQNKPETMHVCDGNSVMVGISEADNVLICASHP